MGDRELSEALGRSLAQVREHSRLRQGDLADAARSLGLPWTRSTVGGVEIGRRQLSAVEVLLLPAVVHVATAVDLTLAELLEVAGIETVQMTPELRVEARRLGGAHSQPDLMLLQFVTYWWSTKVATALQRPLEVVDAAAREAFDGRSFAEETVARFAGYGPEMPPVHRLQLASSVGRSLIEALHTQVLRAEAAAGAHVYDGRERR